jgi:hypothetical protein
MAVAMAMLPNANRQRCLPTLMTTAKTLMPVRLMKFMVLPLDSVLAARLFRRPIIGFGGSVATIRHRGGPGRRLEVAAMGVVRIERR